MPIKPATRRFLGALLCVANAACAGPVPGDTHPRQVIIGFTTPTDTAAPATLTTLSSASGVDVRFVAAVSPRSAAYQLICPPADPACDKAIAALRAQPAIRYLEPDRMKDSR